MVRAILVAAVFCRDGASQTDTRPLPDDPGFEAYLWIDHAFTIDDGVIEGIRKLGINGIDAEGPTGVGRARRTGLPFYVDHAVPKGFLHVGRDAFEEARTRWRKDPIPANLGRPVCLRDPKAMERAVLDLRKTIDALGPAAPKFLSLTDEPSVTRGINPIDWCRDSFCAAAFPRFLSERWGSEALARAAWEPRWPKDGPPVPVDTDEARHALFHDVGSLATVVQWHDTRVFADAGLLDALTQLGAEARRLRPGLEIALLGASMPSAFGGFDWEQLGQRFEAFEPYDWGAAHDLARSCAPRSDLYHTLVPRRPGAPPLAHELWRYFLRGDRGVILFDASTWTGADSRTSGKAPIADAAELLTLFQGPELADWRRAQPLHPQVAILHGMPSTRMLWLLDTRYDGASWFNRLGSYEAAESSEARNREAWAAVLSDMGLTYRFVTPRDLRDGGLLDGSTLALVLPRAIAMSNAEAATITKFAATRFVIADCQTGLFDARLQKRDKGALDDLFGIARPRLKGVDDLVADEPDTRPRSAIVPAEPLLVPKGATPTNAAGTSPLVLVHGVGANRVAYLNMRIGSYVRQRISDPEAAKQLRAMLRPLFLAGRVRPRFQLTQVDAGPEWPYAIHARKKDAAILLAIELSATTGSRPIDWSGPIGTARPRVAVTLPGTYQVTNVLTGEKLGPLNAIEAEVSATRPAIFRLTP